MNLTKIKMFVVLAQWKHFHRAAELCHVSASTLSRNIKQLEEEVGSPLFERDSRSVSLTRAGELFLEYAQQALTEWDAIVHCLTDTANDLHGSLSLYCSVTASYSFLYDILTDFRQVHPKIELNIHTGDPAIAVDRVMMGQEDIAIVMGSENMPKEVSFKPITLTPLQLIEPINASFYNTQIDPYTQTFWDKVPLVVPEKGPAREKLDSWFTRHKLMPKIYAQAAGHEAIVSMVSLGYGVGLVPNIVVENSPLREQVRSFPFQQDLQATEVGVCVLNRMLKRPVISAFWSQILR